MRSSFKRIGAYVQQVNTRNTGLTVTNLQGVSINKYFMPSVANVNGTDLSTYKAVCKDQFAFNPMHVGRDEVLPIAVLGTDEPVIVSPVYAVFEIIDKQALLPEYLMMWCRRPEFDRNAWFTTDSSVRGGFSWDDFCEMLLPVPSLKKQREIVKEYHTIVDRITLNERLNRKLEETAQAIYRQWFVDFEFPISAEYAAAIGKPELAGQPYKSSGGEMVYNEVLKQEIPKGWRDGTLITHCHIKMGQSPKGDTYNTEGVGMPLINGPVEFGTYFTVQAKWTTEPTKMSSNGDLIVCVRGSTTGRFVKSDGEYCLGRGVCSIKGKRSQHFVDQLYMHHQQELITLTTGSTFPNWSSETLSDFPAIVPQALVVDAFDKLISPVVVSKENNFRQIIIMDQLRASLLLRLISDNKTGDDVEKLIRP